MASGGISDGSSMRPTTGTVAAAVPVPATAAAAAAVAVAAPATSSAVETSGSPAV